MAPKSKTLPSKISNPDKVFWPKEGYTKLQLVLSRHALRGKSRHGLRRRDVGVVAPRPFPALRPDVTDRILAPVRSPGGMHGGCFYQKEKPDSMPPGTSTKRIANAAGIRRATNDVVGGALSTQPALANLGCNPVHVCTSRATIKPNWVCLDL